VKVLVIGVTGCSGGLIVDQALQRGYEVAALDRSAQNLTPRDGRP
jgi:uncharacterized protein YbjT (DUF2867 family)